MKILTYKAKIDRKSVDLTEFSVNKSWNTLIDTASVKLPKINVEAGQKIELFGGFNKLDKLFEGFISKITEQEEGLELFCEDKNTLLKNETVTLNFSGGSLSQFLKETDIKAKQNIKAKIGQFRITNATKLQVLNELKKQGIQSFLRDGELIIGLPYKDKFIQKELTFIFFGEQNEVIQNRFQNNAVDIQKFVLEGVNLKQDETREFFYAFLKNGQLVIQRLKPEGQIKTLYFFDLQQNEIKERLKEYFEQSYTKGLSGQFDTFVHKIVKPEDRVRLVFKDSEHLCYVKSVQYSFSFSGGRQTIEIDYEIN